MFLRDFVRSKGCACVPNTFQFIKDQIKFFDCSKKKQIFLRLIMTDFSSIFKSDTCAEVFFGKGEVRNYKITVCQKFWAPQAVFRKKTG